MNPLVMILIFGGNDCHVNNNNYLIKLRQLYYYIAYWNAQLIHLYTFSTKLLF